MYSITFRFAGTDSAANSPQRWIEDLRICRRNGLCGFCLPRVDALHSKRFSRLLDAATIHISTITITALSEKAWPIDAPFSGASITRADDIRQSVLLPDFKIPLLPLHLTLPAGGQPRTQKFYSRSRCRPPLVDPSQDFLCPRDRIANRADCCRNPLSPVVLRELPCRQNRRSNQRKRGGGRVRCTALCCIATEAFLANDGAVPRLRCRSKVAQKVAVHLWNAPTNPNPSGQPNPGGCFLKNAEWKRPSVPS